jgi:hypothetical protein
MSDDEDGGGYGDDDAPALFSCRLGCARDLATMLSCLSHGSRKEQHALVEVNVEGLSVIVAGRAKTTQAQGTLAKDIFSAYECEQDGGRFVLNLTALLDCLQIFGLTTLGTVALAMAYYPDLAMLKLSLEEGQDFTSCELRTLDEDGMEDEDGEFAAHAKAFRGSPEVARCIIKSESLKEAFQELSDLPGAATMTIRVSQTSPHFRLASGGSMGCSEIEFPKRSEAFVHFECDVPKVEWTYQLRALESGMRALNFACETYFRFNDVGILCVQHQIPMTGGKSCFVDFIFVADEDQDEEDGD